MPFAPKSKGGARTKSSSRVSDDDGMSSKMSNLKIRSGSKPKASSKSGRRSDYADYDVEDMGLTSSEDDELNDDYDDDEVTEADLRKKKHITPKDVLKLTKPTKGYLCKPSDNTAHIDFVSFKIRDMDRGGRTLFEVKKPPNQGFVMADDDDDSGRFVRYDFGAQFLQLETVGTTVTFIVGSRAVEDFRMIERHYFKDELLKSFDFDFGFCVPNSRNSCEQIYSMPDLSKKEKQKMIDSPYRTKSDSFYFVKNRLVMHNKADYAYTA